MTSFANTSGCAHAIVHALATSCSLTCFAGHWAAETRPRRWLLSSRRRHNTVCDGTGEYCCGPKAQGKCSRCSASGFSAGVHGCERRAWKEEKGLIKSVNGLYRHVFVCQLAHLWQTFIEGLKWTQKHTLCFDSLSLRQTSANVSTYFCLAPFDYHRLKLPFATNVNTAVPLFHIPDFSEPTYHFDVQLLSPGSDPWVIYYSDLCGHTLQLKWMDYYPCSEIVVWLIVQAISNVYIWTHERGGALFLHQLTIHLFGLFRACPVATQANFLKEGRCFARQKRVLYIKLNIYTRKLNVKLLNYPNFRYRWLFQNSWSQSLELKQ